MRLRSVPAPKKIEKGIKFCKWWGHPLNVGTKHGIFLEWGWEASNKEMVERKSIRFTIKFNFKMWGFAILFNKA